MERPRSPEVLLTEKQGSLRHKDRTDIEAAVERSVELRKLRAGWDSRATRWMGMKVLVGS